MTEAEPAGRIRAYEDRDREAVRELFVRVNRELAPPRLRDLFEAYVELSLREEIDRIPSYYAPERGHGFWVAEGPEGLLGMFGLERVDGDQHAELHGRAAEHPRLDQVGQRLDLLAREAGPLEVQDRGHPGCGPDPSSRSIRPRSKTIRAST